jgi:hypothetical protein
MSLQINLLTECIIANIAGICPLVTTYRFQFCKMKGNNTNNSPLKRNKSETAVHYKDMWIGLSEGGVGRQSGSMSMCVVFVSK